MLRFPSDAPREKAASLEKFKTKIPRRDCWSTNYWLIGTAESVLTVQPYSSTSSYPGNNIFVSDQFLSKFESKIRNFQELQGNVFVAISYRYTRVPGNDCIDNVSISILSVNSVNK